MNNVISLLKRYSRNSICLIPKLEIPASLKLSIHRKDTSTKTERGFNVNEFTTSIQVTCSRRDTISSLGRLSILPNRQRANHHPEQVALMTHSTFLLDRVYQKLSIQK